MTHLVGSTAPSLRAAAPQRSGSERLRHHARAGVLAARATPRTARCSFQRRGSSLCRAVVDDAEAEQNGSLAAARPSAPTAEQQEEAAAPPPAPEVELKHRPSAEANPVGGKAAKEKKMRFTNDDKKPVENVPFEIGSTVWGKVIFSNPKGARVKIDCGVDGIYGYMPTQEGPHTIVVPGIASSEEGFEGGAYQLPLGLTRAFKVNRIPEVVYEDGTGPLISARGYDEEIIWSRLEQMRVASMQDNANFMVRMTGANSGGLMSKVQGMPFFIPYGNIPKLADGWWNEESAKEHFAKKNVEVAVQKALREKRTLQGSIYQAELNTAMSTIMVGALVWGTVRKVTPFGVFVGIDGTRLSALLHISNFSRAHVKNVEDCFEVEDRVRAIVIEMGDDFQRISLSTAELEREHGEILDDPEAVYAAAEETLAELNAAEGEGFEDGGDNYY